MKIIKRCAGLLAATLLVLGLSAAAWGAEFYTVEEYHETLTPNGSDGLLRVEMSALPDDAGWVYLVETVKGMEPAALLQADNVAAGAELEPVLLGEVAVFRLAAADPDAPVRLTAEFACPGLYGADGKADETGAPAIPLSHKFTNPFHTAVGSYSVTAYVPRGEEIVKVSAPKNYSDYSLGQDDGMRSAGAVKDGLAPSEAVTLTLRFGTPVAGGTVGKAVLWAVCLLLGGAVLVARWPQRPGAAAKQTSGKADKA